MNALNPFELSLDEYHPARDRLFAIPKRIGECAVAQDGDPERIEHRGIYEWWITLRPVDPDDRRRWQFSVTTRRTVYVGPHDGGR